jgi:hypothetical protein
MRGEAKKQNAPDAVAAGRIRRQFGPTIGACFPCGHERLPISKRKMGRCYKQIENAKSQISQGKSSIGLSLGFWSLDLFQI